MTDNYRLIQLINVNILEVLLVYHKRRVNECAQQGIAHEAYSLTSWTETLGDTLMPL
jgi:hypothetical protein